MKPRHFFGLRKTAARIAACGVLSIMIASAAARADDYPSRPVTIVTPFAAGSISDATARVMANFLSEAFKKPFIVQNKSGAGGMIAAETVARAAPDGYTLLLTTNSTHSAAPGLFKNVPYDPIKDFTPIARIASLPCLIVANNDAPFKTIQEMVAYVKTHPDKISYGHGNSTGQITGEALKHRVDIKLVRVPYRSVPAGITDLVGGQIQVLIPDMLTALPQIKADRMRPLAVLTTQRSPLLPNVPTLDETVMPGFDLLAWAGMFGPANLPPDIVQKIAMQLHAALQTEDIKSHLSNSGVEIYWGDTSTFKIFVSEELRKWTDMIKEAGIEPE